MINDKFPFPDDWDKKNPRTVSYFNKCSQYVDSQEELLSLFHLKSFFYIYCYFMIICIIISAILILIYRNNYIIKRSSPYLLIQFCIGCIICISNSYGIQVYYTNYPCFLVFYASGISYPMIFISCISCFTKYIKQYYASANAYVEAVNINVHIESKKKKNIILKKKTIENVRVYLIEKHPIYFTIFYVIIITIYSFAVSPLGKNYRIIGHQDLGFCTLSVEYIPQLIIILSFVLLYVPYMLNVLRKIEDTFKIKNLLYISLISMFISIIGYLGSSLIPKYNCTPQFIRLWPTDCFIILTCAVFHFLHVIKPLFELFYVKVFMRKVDKSMKGLKKLLKDKTLYREYVEFCKTECCVENTLFHKEFVLFKDTIYKISNKKNNENNISINTLIMNDKDIISLYNNDSFDSTQYNDSFDYSNDSSYKNYNLTCTESKNNKNDHLILLKMAEDIIEKFILPNSEYEISLDNKITKRILNTFNKYQEMEIDKSFFIEDFENSDFVNIFDDAYEEVLTNLYLNSYLKYIKHEANNK
ncbi:hypothetical protein BCR32DRAFT_267320 [Anaeromyces robustus]|uniref:RGS domain-containing protein n=1 Tax=Anaeromyces robustus TaxID=1754192 RepID=A0A1Y1XB09_9FUNG|nr:hypothetical protein BCR32DRAFT_267320 [Anaeromyces robustus]|eukprot:ORX82935.1 hypothetical protein BCR32DRAFT_267320 [Anaeromyces robustus]